MPRLGNSSSLFIFYSISNLRPSLDEGVEESSRVIAEASCRIVLAQPKETAKLGELLKGTTQIQEVAQV